MRRQERAKSSFGVSPLWREFESRTCWANVMAINAEAKADGVAK
jgi:hypothetical protein